MLKFPPATLIISVANLFKLISGLGLPILKGSPLYSESNILSLKLIFFEYRNASFNFMLV